MNVTVRLFIAVRFNHEVAGKLQAAAAELQAQSIRGHFTRPGNFHLTLVFLGEQRNAAGFIRALEALEADSFDTVLGTTGRFHRDGGDIVFAGFQNAGDLQTLYRAVCRALGPAGFVCGENAYTPHVTLGRGVETGLSSDKARIDDILKGVKISVKAVSLMRSNRMNGELVYSEICAVPLKKR